MHPPSAATKRAAPNETRRHVPLSIAKGKSARDSIIVVSHVDVVPPQKDNAIALLKELAEASRLIRETPGVPVKEGEPVEHLQDFRGHAADGVFLGQRQGLPHLFFDVLV